MIEREAAQTTGIVIREDSVVEIGSVASPDRAFACEEQVDRQVDPGEARNTRLLLRGTMLELYVNDLLIQCCTMASGVTGRVSWTGIGEVRAWYWSSDRSD